MRCTNCGYNNDGDARFCKSCGFAMSFNQNPLAERILPLLKDDLFMALCILYSISVGFSLISGGMPVTRILMTIFLWLIFSQSRKETIASNYMRCISGTIFASYVIKWILCCIVALCGGLLGIWHT